MSVNMLALAAPARRPLVVATVVASAALLVGVAIGSGFRPMIPAVRFAPSDTVVSPVPSPVAPTPADNMVQSSGAPVQAQPVPPDEQVIPSPLPGGPPQDGSTTSNSVAPAAPAQQQAPVPSPKPLPW